MPLHTFPPSSASPLNAAPDLDALFAAEAATQQEAQPLDPRRILQDRVALLDAWVARGCEVERTKGDLRLLMTRRLERLEGWYRATCEHLNLPSKGPATPPWCDRQRRSDQQYEAARSAIQTGLAASERMEALMLELGPEGHGQVMACLMDYEEAIDRAKMVVSQAEAAKVPGTDDELRKVTGHLDQCDFPVLKHRENGHGSGFFDAMWNFEAGVSRKIRERADAAPPYTLLPNGMIATEWAVSSSDNESSDDGELHERGGKRA